MIVFLILTNLVNINLKGLKILFKAGKMVCGNHSIGHIEVA